MLITENRKKLKIICDFILYTVRAILTGNTLGKRQFLPNSKVLYIYFLNLIVYCFIDLSELPIRLPVHFTKYSFLFL